MNNGPIAVIGTAGRDKTKPMDLKLWHWMLDAARSLIEPGSHLVSGGAAWADHIAVELYRTGYASKLTLHLPAPLNGKFLGPHRSAASAANYYHELFSKVVGRNTIEDIEAVCATDNCTGTFEPAAEGYSAMFARNSKVASTATGGMVAFTFGPGKEPQDGGTLNTWLKCSAPRIHISLPINL